ncbi:tail protein X [Niameybacter massiliensis]|uniref:Tail protein X n=1 Tax=Holtiella tumoricola TaxID=3018743 RepID=A0AA42DNY9_9FIRM|nr:MULTISPECIES: tail protein X [Lachnospirales]MDA3732390.1 tail protein X [Holtiella tumoricola]
MDNYIEYTTVDGDTFDIIALDMYNDEFKSHLIIQANPSYAKIITFKAGVVLKVPVVEEDIPETLPPWKR